MFQLIASSLSLDSHRSPAALAPSPLLEYYSRATSSSVTFEDLSSPSGVFYWLDQCLTDCPFSHRTTVVDSLIGHYSNTSAAAMAGFHSIEVAAAVLRRLAQNSTPRVYILAVYGRNLNLTNQN